MRRLTKAQPIGGAWLCSFISSVGVFGRQRVRDGGHELGHLHDRALEAAERGRELHRALAAVEIVAEQAGTGDAGRHAADIGADPRIARRAGGESVGFAIGRAHVRSI